MQAGKDALYFKAFLEALDAIALFEANGYDRHILIAYLAFREADQLLVLREHAPPSTESHERLRERVLRGMDTFAKASLNGRKLEIRAAKTAEDNKRFLDAVMHEYGYLRFSQQRWMSGDRSRGKPQSAVTDHLLKRVANKVGTSKRTLERIWSEDFLSLEVAAPWRALIEEVTSNHRSIEKGQTRPPKKAKPQAGWKAQEFGYGQNSHEKNLARKKR